MFNWVMDAVTAPISDALDVLDGLTEGELRTRAIARLGADAVVGMGVVELLEVLKEED